jgi:hypothetical protein
MDPINNLGKIQAFALGNMMYKKRARNHSFGATYMLKKNGDQILI